jgi:hypothetical protein
MTNEIIEKLLNNVNSPKVDVSHLPWKVESAKQLANGQSDSTTQTNIRAVTSIKKNVKIKEIPSTDICMTGSKETSRNPHKKGIERKMVLCTDTHLENSKNITRSSSKIDSQEPSTRLSKKEVGTKEVLNKDTLIKEDQSTDIHLGDSKGTSRNSKLQRNSPKLKMMIFYGTDSTQQKKMYK